MANKKDHPAHHSILYTDKKDWYIGDKDGSRLQINIGDWRSVTDIYDFWEVIREKMKNEDGDFSDVHFPIFTEENFWKKGEEKIFSGFTYFRNAKFHEFTKFKDVQFSGYTEFNGAKFVRIALFIYVQFSSLSHFQGVQFSARTNFEQTQFSLDTCFHNAQFSERASFLNTRFSERASFSKATFKQKLFFQASDTRTKKEKDKGSPYLQEITFEGATFGGTADFSNRIFTERTSFREATFREAPIFHNAELHQDTDFGRTVFDKSCFKRERASEHFRTLKLAMESKRARREEMMFYAYEQRSLRHENRQAHNKLRLRQATYWTLGGEIIFSLLYQWVSDYGRSYIRALVWLVGVYLAFAGLYWGADVSVARAMEVSVLQFVRPFYIWSDATYPLSTKWVATLETVLGLVIFYLFLQAIQRQFKMR